MVALVVGAAPLAIGAAAGAVGMGAFAARKFRESRTWGFPELTLAIDLGGARMAPLEENGQVRLGDRIVGNYRRESLVSPVPDATLQGSLFAHERTTKGSGKNKRVHEAVVRSIPISVMPNLNDGVLDLDFSVVVPIDRAPVSFTHGVNQVEWTLELRLVTTGPDDRQRLPLTVVPEIRADLGSVRP